MNLIDSDRTAPHEVRDETESGMRNLYAAASRKSAEARRDAKSIAASRAHRHQTAKVGLGVIGLAMIIALVVWILCGGGL